MISIKSLMGKQVLGQPNIRLSKRRKKTITPLSKVDNVDKSDSGHSKRYESREARAKEEERKVGYRSGSTEGEEKEVDGEKRAIHSAVPRLSLDEGDDAKTGGGGGERKHSSEVSTGLGGRSAEAKSWIHSSRGIEKNSLTSAKEESSRGSTNVGERREEKKGGGGTEEVRDKVARESIEVKEEGEAKEKVEGGKDKVGDKTEKKEEVKEEEEKEKKKKKKKKD